MNIRTTITLLFSLMLMAALSACSDDKSEESGVNRYGLQVTDYSTQYGGNIDLQDKVQEIVKSFLPSDGVLLTTADQAYQQWQLACDSLQRYDWAASDYLVAEGTWVEVSLVGRGSTTDGNVVIQKRTLRFPHVVYQFRIADASSRFVLNYRVYQEVRDILETFYDEGETTFFLKRSDAVKKFGEVRDYILAYNWKRNDFALLSGSYFTLQLTGSTPDAALPWPVYAEEVITLPSY